MTAPPPLPAPRIGRAPDVTRLGVGLWVWTSAENVVVAPADLRGLVGDCAYLQHGIERLFEPPWTWHWSLERRIERLCMKVARRALKQNAQRARLIEAAKALR